MPKYKYRCIFYNHAQASWVDNELTPKRCWTYLPNIGVAKEGFWLDQRGEYTQLSDCVTWIPPHQVLCVMKEEI